VVGTLDDGGRGVGLFPQTWRRMDTTVGGVVFGCGQCGLQSMPLLQDLEAAGQMPTILVNNAAIPRAILLLLRMKPDDWDQVICHKT